MQLIPKISAVLLGAALLSSVACGSSKKTQALSDEQLYDNDDSENISGYVEERLLDPIEIMPESELIDTLPLYRASEKIVNDLIHTQLDVRFDWQKQYLLGKASLTLAPHFYPVASLTLDAKGFDVHEVALLNDNNSKTPLAYSYNGNFIQITLPKTYQKGEQYRIFIDYTAKPNERETSGSAAITEDKGLYFINADGSLPDVPQQIWTQGETEASSCWFPTIDTPNERCTQSINITVDKKFVTLSNGKLLSSTPNADGTRTDHWQQEKPHAPYLFMMAVGDFAVVKDQPWRGREVNYFVEKKYEPFAKQIFGNTPEMLDFYSNSLGVEYPWDKFSQVVVREFVSGAMENTSAVVHFDGLQRNDRQLLDETHEDIVAHELFHHWFGDLVTCESWSNLPLNESFATYGEYLWIEHKYGRAEADKHLQDDLEAYMMEASNEQKNLIRFEYNNKEDMFDAHSYQKGGRVLHMLRQYVGDEAFFAALRKYLLDNQYQAVEIHHLRLAFEAVTGEDLNWFFNQWFLGKGHPILNITQDYDKQLQKINVNIEQLQAGLPFQLPMVVDIYENGKKRREKIMVMDRNETFSFDAATAPDLVNVDGEKMLLAEIQDEKPVSQLNYQYFNAPLYRDRLEAISYFAAADASAEKDKVLLAALNDDFWAIREEAVNSVVFDGENTEFQQKAATTLRQIAAKDPKAAVRTTALRKLGELRNAQDIPLFTQSLHDPSYKAMGAALYALADADGETGLRETQKLEQTADENTIGIIGEVYATHGDERNLPFFEKHLKNVSGGERYGLVQSYAYILSRMPADKIQNAVPALQDIAISDKTWWVRFGAANALKSLETMMHNEDSGEGTSPEERNQLKSAINAVQTALSDIYKQETFPRLQTIYELMKASE